MHRTDPGLGERVLSLADVDHLLTVDGAGVVGLSAARVIEDRAVEHHAGARVLVGAHLRDSGVTLAQVRVAQEEEVGGHAGSGQTWWTSSATGVTMPT